MRLTLRASPILTLATACVHAVAAAIFWLYLPQPAGACAATLTIILAILAIKDRTLLRGALAPVLLNLERGGLLIVRLRDGTELKSQVSARRYVNRWLVALRLEKARMGQGSILVARDMLSAADFRRLRLWALWDALPGERSATPRPQGAR